MLLVLNLPLRVPKHVYPTQCRSWYLRERAVIPWPLIGRVSTLELSDVLKVWGPVCDIICGSLGYFENGLSRASGIHYKRTWEGVRRLLGRGSTLRSHGASTTEKVRDVTYDLVYWISPAQCS